MRISMIATVLLIATVPLVVACAPHQASPGFGDSTQQNKALQIIDPMPAHADAGAPELNGARAALAIRRYETNTVIPPRVARTSSTGAAAGGGGGQ